MRRGFLTAGTVWLLLSSMLLFTSCKEAAPLTALDSSKYFRDSKVASFVDDVQRGNAARVKEGLAAGISPNAEGEKGFRPIHFVFFAKDADVLKILLAEGADPNAALASGNTPLHFALRHENVDFTKLLLAAGANPNTPGENAKPPIHEAILQPRAADQVRLLAAAGANIDSVWGGGTSTGQALQIGQWDAAVTLIQLGADLTIRNTFGKTATDIACGFIKRIPANDQNKKGITAVSKALEQRGMSLGCPDEAARFLR